VRSLSEEPAVLRGVFQTSLYSHDDNRGSSFLLADLPLETLLEGQFTQGQLLHVELLWVPKAGATPMDPAATNASSRLVVFAGDEVGIYGGAGFALPRGRMGDDRVTLTIRNASLGLQEATSGFVDLLGTSELTGRFTAEHHPARVRRLYLTMSQRVTDALGESLFVRGPARPTCVFSMTPPLKHPRQDAGGAS
jgi:hypothetical protein